MVVTTGLRSHRKAPHNKVIWPTRSEMLGSRSPTKHLLKLLSLPVPLDSLSNLVRQAVGWVSGRGPEAQGVAQGPGAGGGSAVPGAQAAGLPAGFFALGTGCVLTNAEEVPCQRGSRRRQWERRMRRHTQCHAPLLQAPEPQSRGFWDHGVYGEGNLGIMDFWAQRHSRPLQPTQGVSPPGVGGSLPHSKSCPTWPPCLMVLRPGWPRLTISDDFGAKAEDRRGAEGGFDQGGCQQTTEESEGP